MKKVYLVIIIIYTVMYPSAIYADSSIWVQDENDLISRNTTDYITKLNEKIFSTYKDKPQLGIIVTDKLPDNKDINSYKNEMFNVLGIGTRKENCGMLLVIAVQDRKYGFEIGDGFKNKSLLRKDLEKDFIYPMKNYLTTGNYDKVVFESAKYLEQIMLDEENGVYTEKENNQNKEIKDGIISVDGSISVFTTAVNIGVKCISIGLIIMIAVSVVLKLIKNHIYKSRLNKYIENHKDLVDYVKINKKDAIKDIIHMPFSRTKSPKDMCLQYLYDVYLKECKKELQKHKKNSDLYIKKIEEINNIQNFKSLNIVELKDIIHEVDKEIILRKKIIRTNRNKIKKFIDQHENEFDKKIISITMLISMMNRIVSDKSVLSEGEIKKAFYKEIKNIGFEYEYNKFLTEHEKEINTKYFNSSELFKELKKSDEYKNYTGLQNSRNLNNLWMLTYLNLQITSRKEQQQRKHDEINSFNSPFGGGFGGGTSSGGGFTGGW